MFDKLIDVSDGCTADDFEQYCKDCQMQPLDNGTFRNNDGNINPQVTWQLTSDFKYKVYIWATGD